MHTTTNENTGDKNIKKISEIYPKLRYYALHLEHSNQEDADDLLHDTVVRMIEKMDRFVESRSDNLMGWGMAVMHNLFVDRKRKEIKVKCRTRYISEIERFDYPQPFDEPREKVMKEKLKIVKDRLKNSKHLELFIMRSLGLSYKEISRIIDSTETTVKTRIHHMKMELVKKPEETLHENEFLSYKEAFMNVFQQDRRKDVDFALMIVSTKKNVEVDRVKGVLKPFLEELTPA
jgi:RNA polymerase sigma-70 factor, ECF subfamily